MTKQNNNLKLAAGLYFTAKIKDIPAVGVVQKQDENFYLCQNVKDGSPCREKFGYAYSWTIDKGRPRDLALDSVRVTDLKLFKNPPKGVQRIPTKKQLQKMEDEAWIKNPRIGGYNVRYTSKGVKFGCTEVEARQVMLIVGAMQKHMREVKKAKTIVLGHGKEK